MIAPVDDDGSLTEAEKMLLLMCQTEASANKKDNESMVEMLKEEPKQHCLEMDQLNQTDFTSPIEPSINKGLI